MTGRGDERWFPTIVWGHGEAVLPDYTETVVRISLESNPLYSPDATEQEVQAFAVRLAGHLGRWRQQVEIYVAIYAIESLIVEI